MKGSYKTETVKNISQEKTREEKYKKIKCRHKERGQGGSGKDETEKKEGRKQQTEKSKK